MKQNMTVLTAACTAPIRMHRVMDAQPPHARRGLGGSGGRAGASTRSKESVAVELRRLAGVVRRSRGGCGGLVALVWSSRNKGLREEVVETVVGGG